MLIALLQAIEENVPEVLTYSEAMTSMSPETSHTVLLITAAAGGSLINILRTRKASTTSIDSLIAGVTSFFAGIFLTPLLGDWLLKMIPEASKDQSEITMTAAVALFGAILIEKIFERLKGDDTQEDKE